jgi:uncharacterized membrane protein YbaN (DUF454 family)
MRIIYAALGWCAVGLAIAGVLLPGLPATIFVIAASFCFARSSPRFERWLRNNRWLGPPLRRFAATGGMPRSAKRAALTAMWTAVLLSAALLAPAHWRLSLFIVGMGAVGTLSIVFGVRTVPEQADVSPV